MMDMVPFALGILVLLGAGGWVGNWVSTRVLNSAHASGAKVAFTRAIDVGLGSNAKPAAESELKLPEKAA